MSTQFQTQAQQGARGILAQRANDTARHLVAWHHSSGCVTAVRLCLTARLLRRVPPRERERERPEAVRGRRAPASQNYRVDVARGQVQPSREGAEHFQAGGRPDALDDLLHAVDRGDAGRGLLGGGLAEAAEVDDLCAEGGREGGKRGAVVR